jgi:hypothetical protein
MVCFVVVELAVGCRPLAASRSRLSSWRANNELEERRPPRSRPSVRPLFVALRTSCGLEPRASSLAILLVTRVCTKCTAGLEKNAFRFSSSKSLLPPAAMFECPMSTMSNVKLKVVPHLATSPCYPTLVSQVSFYSNQYIYIQNG